MTETDIQIPDEFSSTMQRLVAEAEKTVAHDSAQSATEMRREISAINERINRLDQTVAAGLDKITTVVAKGGTQPWQLERIDENLRALRKTESVNQRLFDSLHEELRSYRDNFLRDSLQKPVVRDLVILLDDLSALATSLPIPKNSTKTELWRGNLENTIHTLVEILHRLEVNEIAPQERVDLALHRVMECEPAADAADDGRIVRRLKRGFIWHGQVLRPEEVVASRFA
ncbi:MAG: nucleotide exchange factor GrpE [Chthoniobacterales bacterium]